MIRAEGFADFEALVRNSPNFIAAVDHAGTLLFINRSSPNGSAEELIGTSAYTYLPPESQEIVRKAIGKVVQTGEFIDFELMGPAADGTARWYACHAGPLRRDGRIAAVVVNATDITEWKNIEETLTQRETEARTAYEELLKLQEQLIRTEQSRALGEMSAGVAHQFNNVLMMVEGLTELALAHFNDHERVKKYLEEIKVSAADGAHIVRRLQTFVRRTADQELQSISVNEVIQNSLQLAQPKWKNEAEKKGAYIRVRTDLQAVPPVEGLESELREVLVNLILNAVDAMPAGGTMDIGTRHAGDKVQIQVRDSGMGMTAEVKEKLFIPFFSTKVERGTGLGLFICRNIITRMGGTVIVESEENRGSTFFIELPAMKRGSTSKRKPTTTRVVTPGAPARILVVDDEPAICEIVQGFLETARHHVVTCTDPRRAIERCSQDSFDMIITDLGMAPLNGWDVLREVRKLRPQIKTVLLTGWGMNVEPAEAAAKGADIILSKPIELKPFLKVIRQMLSGPC